MGVYPSAKPSVLHLRGSSPTTSPSTPSNPLQPRHALGLLGQRAFVHVTAAVDLSWMLWRCWAGGAVAAHQFHAFVGVVVFHAGSRARRCSHQGDRGGAMVVPSRSPTTKSACTRPGSRWRGWPRWRAWVAVDVDAVAVAGVGGVNGLGHGGVVGAQQRSMRARTSSTLSRRS